MVKIDLTSKFKNYIKNELFYKKISVIFVIVLFLGIILGSSLVGFFSTDTFENINSIFMDNLKERNYGFNISNFVFPMVTLLFFTFLMIFSALSFFGSFMIFLILFIRGIGIGILTGCIYTTYLLKGIFFCALILSPGFFISSMALVSLAAKSLIFSLKFAKKIFPISNSEVLWPEFLNYIKKLSIIVLILIISSLVDFLLIGLFCNMFKF